MQKSVAEAKGFNTRHTAYPKGGSAPSKLHHHLRVDLMHQPTDWLAARQPPDRCLEEPRAGQLLSLALGHLAVRVDAALMIAPPGLTRIRSLRTGSVRSVLCCLHDLKRCLKHSRHHLQRVLTAWDCSRLYCHPASASCKMQLVLLLLIRATLVSRASGPSTGT